MPAAGLEAELALIGAMTIDQARAAWRKVFASDPPPAFSKDLLARAIAFHAQSKGLAGLTAPTARLLRTLIKPGVEPPRRVKVGSVIVREYQGVVHEVLVVPGGFCWQRKTYDSLSIIAKTITGTSWNGPRFFGLREKKDSRSLGSTEEGCGPASQGDGELSNVHRASRKRSGRRSSLRAGLLASERAP
jgi:hypothetical protein